MRREIYRVYAEIVDKNGNYNTVSGYPKTFDSRGYDNDCDKTLQRASGELSAAHAAMSKIDERKLQIAWLIRAKTCEMLDKKIIGTIPDDPGQVSPE